MKRCLTAVCLSVLLLTGCSMPAGGEGTVQNCMTGGFSAEVTITNAESETHGILTRLGTEAWRAEFTDPPALSGVQLEFVDGEVTASYKGLAFSVPQSAQAIRTELSELMEAVDALSLEPELSGTAEEDSICYAGELEVGSYTLTLAQDGTPQRFELPAYGLCIGFDSFTAQQLCTETETIPRTFPVPEEETCTETDAAE